MFPELVVERIIECAVDEAATLKEVLRALAMFRGIDQTFFLCANRIFQTDPRIQALARSFVRERPRLDPPESLGFVELAKFARNVCTSPKCKLPSSLGKRTRTDACGHDEDWSRDFAWALWQDIWQASKGKRPRISRAVSGSLVEASSRVLSFAAFAHVSFTPPTHLRG